MLYAVLTGGAELRTWLVSGEGLPIALATQFLEEVGALPDLS